MEEDSWWLGLGIADEETGPTVCSEALFHQAQMNWASLGPAGSKALVQHARGTEDGTHLWDISSNTAQHFESFAKASQARVIQYFVWKGS